MSRVDLDVLVETIAALGVALLPSQALAQGVTTPTVPGIVARVTSQGSGSVSWTAVPGATGYHIVRWNTADLACCKGMSVPNLAAGSTSWQDGTLPRSGTYTYRVYATTAAGTYAGEARLVYTSGVASTSDPSLNANVTAVGASGGGTSLSSGPTSTLSRPSQTVVTPAPTNLQITGGVTTADLSWDPVAGATGYQVKRAVSGTTNWTPVTSQPIAATKYSGDVLPDPRVSYTYQVIALLAAGTSGAATRTYQPPLPADPTEFSAVQTGENEVELSWRDAPGVGKYLISGAGAGNGVPASSNAPTLANLNVTFGKSTFKLTGVPHGAQEWTIASSYEPGGVLTTSTSWPRATLTVGTLSGRYRVTLLGFEVNAQTTGDPSGDGLGDEVYLAAHVSTYNLSNNSWGVRGGLVRSLIHGDTTRLPGRVRAGSAGANGGLKSGDKYLVSVSGSTLPTTPKTNTVPMLLWEGQLTNDADALLIAPAVWESDGNDSAFSDWRNWVQTVLDPARMPSIQQELTASGITPVRHSDNAYVGRINGPGMDHPIGIVTMSAGSATTYAQWYLALTRRKIEAALSPSSTVGGLPPGVLTVPVKDLYSADGFGGAYTLYLFVERRP